MAACWPGHTHDRDRNPRTVTLAGFERRLGNGNGYAKRAHLLAEHPELAEDLMTCEYGGVGIWPSRSYVDEAHTLEHQHPVHALRIVEPSGATATLCPECGYELVAPEAADEAGWASWYCQGCGSAWAWDLTGRVL
jgi:hypothetical protein